MGDTPAAVASPHFSYYGEKVVRYVASDFENREEADISIILAMSDL